jgi:hypothetical protein
MVDAFHSGNAFEVDLVHARKMAIFFGHVLAAHCRLNTIQYFCYSWRYFTKKRYDESLEIEKKIQRIIANMI